MRAFDRARLRGFAVRIDREAAIEARPLEHQTDNKALHVKRLLAVPFESEAIIERLEVRGGDGVELDVAELVHGSRKRRAVTNHGSVLQKAEIVLAPRVRDLGEGALPALFFLRGLYLVGKLVGGSIIQ